MDFRFGTDSVLWAISDLLKMAEIFLSSAVFSLLVVIGFGFSRER